MTGKESGASLKDGEELTINGMTEADLGEVLDIERAVFSEPWTESLFRGELSLFLSHCRTARIASGELAGYSVFWIVSDEVHLHVLAVKKEWQRRGVASALVEDMLHLARGRGVRTATLEVRPSNAGARRLYDKFGFREQGRRPSYYTDTGEDALIMGAVVKEKDDA